MGVTSMSDEFNVEGAQNQSRLREDLDAYHQWARQRPKGEVVESGIRELDGITFAYSRLRFGNALRTTHEIVLSEGGKDFHIMPLLDERGNMYTAVQIASDKREVDEKLEARVVLYMLEPGKLKKVMDAKVRGTPWSQPTYEEMLQYVLDGKHMDHPFEIIEEE